MLAGARERVSYEKVNARAVGLPRGQFAYLAVMSRAMRPPSSR
jgi:hypothetical protein